MPAENNNDRQYDADILVADDTEMYRRIFSRLLCGKGIRMTEASCGMECLEKAADTEYDIIFLDNMLPDMNGTEILSAMRMSGKCRRTPVVVLASDDKDAGFYISAGFDGFIAKPIDPNKLEQLVSDILYKASAGKKKVYNDFSELPVIDGIDWRYAQLHFNDFPAMVRTIRMFLRMLENDAAELSKYYDLLNENNGYKNYRIKIHSMKNSAALIGIVQLAGMAMTLEYAARNSDYDTINSLHAIFLNIWGRYKDLLSDFAETNDSKKNAADFSEDIEKIFSDIRKAAADMDVDTLDEMSRRLDEYSFEPVMASKIETIKESILNFEIEKLIDCEYK